MNINAMKCFFMCLPLVEDRFLKDFFYRVAGEPDHTYLMTKLKDFWELIPDSPSKNYVEKYIYFHLTAPSVDDEDPSLAPDKYNEYRLYRGSRAYEEEEFSYRLRLRDFRFEMTEL